jgi:hypothetical protein
MQMSKSTILNFNVFRLRATVQMDQTMYSASAGVDIYVSLYISKIGVVCQIPNKGVHIRVSYILDPLTHTQYLQNFQIWTLTVQILSLP